MRTDWNEYKDIIYDLYIINNNTKTQVLEELDLKYGFRTKTRSLETRLKLWGFQKKGQGLCEEISTRVDDLWKETRKPSDLATILNEEGYNVSTRKVQQYRSQKKMRYRTKTTEKAERQEECNVAVRQSLQSGQTIRYGRNLMQTHLRLEGNLFSQGQVREALAIEDPIGLKFRQQKQKTQRIQFKLNGPNELWSIDGHDKLSRFGIQIYGAIDGYSRHIIWMYVGISNRTAISVNKQFLHAIKSLNRIPKRMRTDKGQEVLQMVASLLLFYQSIDPDILISEIHRFGTSKHNIKIESWWKQLLESHTSEWLSLFQQYEEEGLFTGGYIDIICIQFVYMDMIRTKIHSYVKTWNHHPIRKQKNRPYVLPGQPNLLFRGHTPTGYPSADMSFGIEPNKELLEELEEMLAAYDLDIYLPSETYSVCLHYTKLQNWQPPFDFDTHPHREIYISLRQALQQHELQKLEPRITLLAPPRGNLNWIREELLQQVVEQEYHYGSESCSDDVV